MRLSMRVFAVIPDMEMTYRKMVTDADSFESAANATKDAADTVAAGWEGDSREAFVAEQAQAYQYFMEMVRLVRGYAWQVAQASANYTDTDENAAGILYSVGI